jgi:hypothetical protein
MSTLHSNFLGVTKLALIIAVISFACGVFLPLDLRTYGFLWQTRLVVLGAGPLLCLFLVGMLFVAFFRDGKRSLPYLLFGATIGLATFGLWVYSVSR